MTISKLTGQRFIYFRYLGKDSTLVTVIDRNYNIIIKDQIMNNVEFYDDYYRFIMYNIDTGYKNRKLCNALGYVE